MDQGRLTVLAAASLTEAFTAIGAAFERSRPGAAVELSFAGSPQLLAQMDQGAPADVLASADEEVMQRALEAGLVLGPPAVVARNTLAIAVRRGNPLGIDALADLSADGLLVGLVVEAVPAGRYARLALDRAGVEVSPTTLEPNVKALLTKVALGEIDAGVVYRSDVSRPDDDVAGVSIPAEQNVVATYPMARTAGARDRSVADAFMAFALSPDGQAILAEAGFLAP